MKKTQQVTIEIKYSDPLRIPQLDKIIVCNDADKETALAIDAVMVAARKEFGRSDLINENIALFIRRLIELVDTRFLYHVGKFS